MSQERLGEQLGIAMAAFSSIPEVSDELAESLVEQGFFTFDDLSVIEPDQLAELGGHRVFIDFGESLTFDIRAPIEI